MKHVFLASVLLAACQPQAATAPTTPTSPWCSASTSHAGKTMPSMQSDPGALPPDPTSQEFAAMVYASPANADRLWAIYVDGGQVIAWHDLARATYVAYQGKVLDSLWGGRWVPRIGVTPPPPPPDDGTDEWYAAYFLETLLLELAIPELAESRARTR